MAERILPPDLTKKVQTAGTTLWRGILGLYSFFRDKKNDSKLMTVLAVISCGFAIYFLVLVLGNLNDLRQKVPQLRNISSYDIRVLAEDALTQNIIKNIDTLDDLIQEYTQTQKEITTYKKHLSSLQVPYTYLLQYVYLPSLNIRKDPFTQEINPNIIGLEYLQRNPYNDITLLQRRSDFFKYVGDNNESNDITDINIGNIAEDQSGYFSIPITVSFIANSKRAFLLLVDKLSMTSNSENISLIDEFFFYLWDEIKKEKSKELDELTQKYSELTGFATESMTDKVIAYHLYHRIFHDKANILVDKKVIDQTVKSIMVCNNQSDELCYYQFREKYRNIPTFGYLIGTSFASDPARNLKTFVQNMPPIFSIREFTFDKLKTQVFTDAQAIKYQGKVTIEVYGKGISTTEINEIANALGAKCLSDGSLFSVDRAVQIVVSSITALSNLTRIDKAQSDNLRELKKNLEKIQQEYQQLSPYKQVIKLFEAYRMINEAGLCK